MTSLFKSSPPPPTPTPFIMPSAPPPTPAMPDPMSPAARESSMNDLASNMSGQAGTNMTGKKDRKSNGTILGGGGTDSYGGAKLGGA